MSSTNATLASSPGAPTEAAERSLKACSPPEVREHAVISLSAALGPHVHSGKLLPASCSPARKQCPRKGPLALIPIGSGIVKDARLMCPMKIALSPAWADFDASPTCMLTSAHSTPDCHDVSSPEQSDVLGDTRGEAMEYSRQKPVSVEAPSQLLYHENGLKASVPPYVLSREGPAARTCSNGSKLMPECSPTTTCCPSEGWAESSECSSPDRSEGSDAQDDTVDSRSEPDTLAIQVAELVQKECGFLRMQGYHVCTETHVAMMRQGVTECVVFRIRGLPQSKRTKWMVPLCHSLSAVLQRLGCKTKVVHGMLLVALRDGDAMVRFDFVSSF